MLRKSGTASAAEAFGVDAPFFGPRSSTQIEKHEVVEVPLERKASLTGKQAKSALKQRRSLLRHAGMGITPSVSLGGTNKRILIKKDEGRVAKVFKPGELSRRNRRDSSTPVLVSESGEVPQLLVESTGPMSILRQREGDQHEPANDVEGARAYGAAGSLEASQLSGAQARQGPLVKRVRVRGSSQSTNFLKRVDSTYYRVANADLADLGTSGERAVPPSPPTALQSR